MLQLAPLTAAAGRGPTAGSHADARLASATLPLLHMFASLACASTTRGHRKLTEVSSDAVPAAPVTGPDRDRCRSLVVPRTSAADAPIACSHSGLSTDRPVPDRRTVLRTGSQSAAVQRARTVRAWHIAGMCVANGYPRLHADRQSRPHFVRFDAGAATASVCQQHRGQCTRGTAHFVSLAGRCSSCELAVQQAAVTDGSAALCLSDALRAPARLLERRLTS